VQAVRPSQAPESRSNPTLPAVNAVVTPPNLAVFLSANVTPPPAAVLADAVESPAAAISNRVVEQVLPAAKVEAIAAVSAVTVSAAPQSVSASTWPNAATRSRSRLPLVVLWFATATIPATVVWLLMRTPKHAGQVAIAKPTFQQRAVTAASPPPVQKPAVPQLQIDVPHNAARNLAEPAAPANVTATAPTQSAAASPSAPSPAPSTPVVVETDSTDRVNVVVKSRPPGARIYRRGKEIGRTPLTIQIGRGEHRIFEVGLTSSGARRISVDGEKPEITVNLAVEAKP